MRNCWRSDQPKQSEKDRMHTLPLPLPPSLFLGGGELSSVLIVFFIFLLFVCILPSLLFLLFFISWSNSSSSFSPPLSHPLSASCSLSAQFDSGETLKKIPTAPGRKKQERTLDNIFFSTMTYKRRSKRKNTYTNKHYFHISPVRTERV